MVTKQPDSLPHGAKVVTVPTELPRRFYEPGEAMRLLKRALGMKATTPETGLNPHIAWNSPNEKDLKRRYAALVAAKRRHKDEFLKVSLSQHNNLEKKTHTIYIWHQE